MNLMSLYYFLQVCQVLNFSKAAELLFVSPQGISKSIKTLETELGCLLFQRTPNGLRLTEYGTLLEVHAKKIVEELRQLKYEYQQLDREATRKLRIGVTMGASQIIGANYQKKLVDAFPFLTIEFQDSWDLECEEKVLLGDFDVAISSGPLDLTLLDAKVLASSSVCAMVPKGHPLSSKKMLKIRDLAGIPLLVASSHFRLYSQIVEACRTNGFEPQISGTTILIESMFRQDLDANVIGIGIDAYTMHREPTTYRLIPFSQEELVWQLVVIARKATYIAKEITWLQEAIWKCLRFPEKQECAPLSESGECSPMLTEK